MNLPSIFSFISMCVLSIYFLNFFQNNTYEKYKNIKILKFYIYISFFFLFLILWKEQGYVVSKITFFWIFLINIFLYFVLYFPWILFFIVFWKKIKKVFSKTKMQNFKLIKKANFFLFSFLGMVEWPLTLISYDFWDINFTFIMFIIPFISLLILLLVWPFNKIFVYDLSLGLSSINFSISFLLLCLFDTSKTGFQFSCSLELIPSIIYPLHLGIDGISIFFILLTYLFIYLCILSLNYDTPKIKEAIFHLFFLQWTVTASFLFIDLLGFFLFFEMTLIPIYFLVLSWGSRERRVRASYLISLYTMFGSIFLFFNLLYLYSKTGTTDYELLLTFQLNKEDQLFLWITFFLSFAAKIPVFPLHIWLPEAHVEAPTLGSVLLAVLLLKLGTYGLIRFSLPLLPEGTLCFSSFVVLFAVLGIIYTCMTAIRQIDLKKIIAYSSVGHMNVVLLGIMSESSEGLQGAVFQMLSHGIVSGALFFGVGALYERYTVRSLKYFGGLTYFYPLLSIVFLIFFLANISFPLTSSFVGEFLIFMGYFRQSFWGTFFASTSMVLGAVYTLWTYNRIFFGNIRILSIIYFKDLTKKELALFGILILILFLMGIFPYIFLDFMLSDIVNLLEHAKH